MALVQQGSRLANTRVSVVFGRSPAETRYEISMKIATVVLPNRPTDNEAGGSGAAAVSYLQ